MGLSILPPLPDEVDFVPVLNNGYDSESDASMNDDDDEDNRPSKRLKLSGPNSVVVPGEIITDETQWMRYVPI